MATTTININSSIKVNTTPIESGVNGRVLFQDTDKVNQSSNLFWNNTNSRLSIGMGNSPQARVDILSQGALSTDIAFRVQNSTNTSSIFKITGDGRVTSKGVNQISSNEAFGDFVFSNTVSGTGNSAFTTFALSSLTTGSENNAFGRSALANVTTGGRNSGFGFQVLVNGNGNSTVGFGYRSGAVWSGGNVTAFNQCVYLGSEIQAGSATPTNEVVIGFGAIGLGNNTVVLGNSSIVTTQLRGTVRFSLQSSAPTGVEGAIYYDSTAKKHYGYNGTSWNALY